MFIPLPQTFLGAALLLSSLSISALVTGLTQHRPRDTAELYIFANCINNSTHPPSAYAAIFWYYPDFLPDYPEAQLTAIVSHHTCPDYDYANKTTAVTAPFSLTAVIPANATTVVEDEIVSTDCKASSFAGPMAVFKGSGEVFYAPETHVHCIWEYYQQDHQSEDDD